MFKALGIGMILFSCCMFSYIKAGELKQKYHNMKQMKKALTVIKNEISFSSRELAGAAAEAAKALSGEMSDFFQAVAKNLSENETSDFGHAWEKAREEFTGKPFLPAAAEKMMIDFSQKAGKMSREIEIENIERTTEALDREITDERENYAKNRKLIYTLGIAGGLAVTILFI